MKKVKLLYGLLCLLCFPLAAQRPEIPLQTQSSNIRERLLNLKQQSAELTTLCQTLQTDLEKSQAEAQIWRQKSTELSESLTTINGELSSCYENITRLEVKTKAYLKAVEILLTILVVLAVIKAVGYALYFRGVRVPRWLDILI